MVMTMGIRGKSIRWKIAAGAAVLTALFAWFMQDGGDGGDVYEERAAEESRTDLEILAPDVHMEDQAGRDADMRSLYNEKPVLLIAWMPWSSDSRRQLAEAQALYGEYGGRVHFVMLTLGSDAEEGRAYYEKEGYTMPLYTGHVSIAYDYNIYEVPQTVVIRRGGAVSSRRKGVVGKRTLAYLIEKGLHP